MDESERAVFDLGELSLVDVSFSNDAPVNSSSSFTNALHDHQLTENGKKNISSDLLEAIDAETPVDTADNSLQIELLPQLAEPVEPKPPTRNGKCNLRKSLAWDTAFFTSAGVLDPEELSSILEGVDQGGKRFLPVIEEDIRGSADSFTTLESETLTLESLEGDLFEDIRASIQRCSRTSNMASSTKAAVEETKTQVNCSLKKVDFTSKTTMQPTAATKKQSIGTQGPGRLTKQSSGCLQGTQPVIKIGGLNPSVQKAPKVIVRPNLISSAPLRKVSLAADNQVKCENNKAKTASVPGKVAQVSKAPPSSVSHRVVPRPAVSSKSSSSNSSTATKKEPLKSPASSDSSYSASSPNVGISSVKSTRTKIGSRTVNQTSSSSILKTPSKVFLKKKGEFRVPPCLVSSKLSSNISPASSISEWSSESCSSTSTVNQRSNTSNASIDTSYPGRSPSIEASPALDHLDQCSDQFSDRRENKASRLPGENAKITSMPNGALSRPATVQPSGLRMPSPKIGFFDGAKPVVHSPNGNLQAYSGTSAGRKTRPGIPSGGSSKEKILKLQPVRAVTATANMKLDTHTPVSSASSKKQSSASTKVSGASAGAKNCLSISCQVQNEANRESCLKAEEIDPKGPTRADDVPDTGLDAEKCGYSGVFMSEMNLHKQMDTNLQDAETVSIQAEIRASISHCDAENEKLSKEVGEDAISGLQYLKNHLPSLYTSNEKENTRFEGQIDGFVMHLGAGDLNQEKQQLQKELVSHTDSEEPPSNLSLSAVTYEVNTRTPFTAKDSFFNGGGFDISSRLSVEVVEKTSFPSSESSHIEST